MSQTLLETPTTSTPASASVQAETECSLSSPPASHGPGRTLAAVSVEESELVVSKSRTAAVISSITCITAIGSLLAGLLTVCIPVIAQELEIPESLQLWPASIYALTCGCTLLLCGSAADVVGCRRMYLAGTLLQSAFTLGCGLATTAAQLIVFRGLAGVAASFCLPSAVSIVTSSFPTGQRRNVAFAAMGGGQPVGFGLGLVLGGVFAGTAGWRWGFHATAVLNTAVFALALWALPRGIDPPLAPSIWTRLARDIDWAGALLISAALALVSYVFAAVTGSARSIRKPLNIALLAAAAALVPAFALWMRRQTRLGRPALIPNALWANGPFAAVCLTVFLVWGAFNAVEQLAAFYLEYVLQVSPLRSSVYFLPAPVSGALANVAVGLLLPRLRPSVAVPAACAVAALAPLLLAALCRVDGPSYWAAVFEAMALNPIGPDVIYTIANLVITAAFPGKTQALAGSVFNAVAQIGKSTGLAATAVIAARVTAEKERGGGFQGELGRREALLEGYKAGWWYCCALGLVTVGVSAWGLRKVGKVGVKRE
ncbi:Asparagine synthase [Neofusicoccum parvum]|uniref:Asparagine synthase n=1 Tax=Neofusicoccum parvum TaxID=310453 RepID=A0ACB5RV96_9PEZI|nr:Asparagine synthase [Neofusicoccum parvum]